MQGHKSVKSIHGFTSDFLADWFPTLGAYESFNHRLTQVSDAFVAMLEKLVDASDDDLPFSNFRLLIDSLPIVMAHSRRSSTAKVAPELADKGYCDSKKMFYYGVKLHVAGHDRDSTLPKPSLIGLTPASYHDLTAFKQVAPELDNCEIFSDKAYADQRLQKELRENQTVILATPIKRKKGQDFLDSADRLYSKAVSSIRQPIESLFNWIEEKTGIQRASKVRSHKGLMVHVFGRMVAAFMMLKI
jgi:Transposase DDE domain